MGGRGEVVLRRVRGVVLMVFEQDLLGAFVAMRLYLRPSSALKIPWGGEKD
jgi:hypothetical protein